MAAQLVAHEPKRSRGVVLTSLAYQPAGHALRPPAERARVLHRIVELLRRDHEVLARLESMDTGKALKQARADVTVAARYFEFYANTIESFYGDTIPALADTFVYTVREPYGVTAQILPWN